MIRGEHILSLPSSKWRYITSYFSADVALIFLQYYCPLQKIVEVAMNEYLLKMVTKKTWTRQLSS